MSAERTPNFRPRPMKPSQQMRRDQSTGGVGHRGQNLPVSKTMRPDHAPGEIVSMGDYKVREHKDGRFTTLDGRAIIRNEDDAKRWCDATGFRRDPDFYGDRG